MDNTQTDNTPGVGGTVVVGGTWEVHTDNWGYQGINFLLSPAVSGNGANTVTWRPNIATTGQYQVYMRQGLASYAENPPRATNAPYTINHASGSNVVAVNHNHNQASWVYLGTYTFNAGTAGTVVAADNANGRVVADAIRLEPLPYAEAATWTAPVTVAGSYKLYLRTPEGYDLARDAKYFVTHAGGESVYYHDQRENNGAQWRLMGTWTFTPGQGHKVVLPAGPVTNPLTADAIAWVPAAATITYDQVAWNPAQAGLAAGTYAVEVNWLRQSNQGFPASATHTVTHAGGTAQVPVTPALPSFGSWEWQNLGTFTFNAAGHEVKLSTVGMDTLAVAADAVRFTPSGGAATVVNLTSPTAGQTYTAPATVTLTATAMPAAGKTIQVVDFYNGATLIGHGSLGNGWNLTWSNVAQGSYTISARATDNTGIVTISNSVQITVNAGGGGGTVTPGIYFIETDQLNTPRRISNQAQQVVWRWDQAEAFGDSVPNEQPTAGLAVFNYNPRFAGQYADKETGRAYNYFRDYDPAIGRYVQSDPIGLRGGINTYTYVGGNPLSKIDPRGLCPCEGGSWDQDILDVQIGISAGGAFSVGKLNLTCRSNKGLRCSGTQTCIGIGTPNIGVSGSAGGVVFNAADSSNLSDWSTSGLFGNWNLGVSAGPIQGQINLSGGGGNAGVGVGTTIPSVTLTRCFVSDLKCNCACEKP